MEQSYANHVHRPAVWNVSALSGLLGFLAMAVLLVQQPGLASAGLVLLAVSLVCVVLVVRQSAVKLQNRIIRLEMLTRLGRLGRDSDFAKLALPQVIALRFASDAELPALMQRAIAEALTADQIKRAVTDWQADLLRA